MRELELNIYLDALVAAAEAKGSLEEIQAMREFMEIDDRGRTLALIAGCVASIETVQALIVQKFGGDGTVVVDGARDERL